MQRQSPRTLKQLFAASTTRVVTAKHAGVANVNMHTLKQLFAASTTRVVTAKHDVVANVNADGCLHHLQCT
jgi:hypothetical protein